MDPNISPEYMDVLRAPTYKKMTRCLMVALFTKLEMKNSSVTGRKGINAETAKQALDPDKVKFVIGKPT